MKITDLLSNPNRWCKHATALSATGKRIHPQSKKAVQWCLTGAIAKCSDTSDQQHLIMSDLHCNLRTSYPQFGSLIEFNDDPHTTFLDIRTLLNSNV